MRTALFQIVCALLVFIMGVGGGGGGGGGVKWVSDGLTFDGSLFNIH